MDRPTCATCIYWKPSTSVPYGECRAKSPVACTDIGTKDKPDIKVRAIVTNGEYYWCGEWTGISATLGTDSFIKYVLDRLQEQKRTEAQPQRAEGPSPGAAQAEQEVKPCLSDSSAGPTTTASLTPTSPVSQAQSKPTT